MLFDFFKNPDFPRGYPFFNIKGFHRNEANFTPWSPKEVASNLRRSEPSSRTAFMGEQPNPWDVLPPQDAMSRHRGAKPSRRCELLDSISLLSLAYLLSDERRQFHILPSDHLGLLSHLLDMYVSQLTWFLAISSTHSCQPC